MSYTCEENRKKSVTEIFTRMIFTDKITKSTFQDCNDCLKTDKATDSMENLSELFHILKRTPIFKNLDNAVCEAAKAQNKWKNSSSLERADSFHKIWKCIQDNSKSVSKFKSELSTLASYFDFYADLVVLTEGHQNLGSCGIVLIVLPNYCPFFVLGATVAPALATGCSVVVVVPEEIKSVSFFLSEVISEAGLPEGVFNTVIDSQQIDLPVSKDISKIFFCGSYLPAVELYKRNVTQSLKFFSPGNTAAFILESGDLDAAVDKIVKETWMQNSLFAVSNIVIQESVYKKFLEKLKYRLQQFLDINKYSSEFKCKMSSYEVNEIIAEPLSMGDFDEKKFYYGNEITQNGPLTVFKVQPCRTAKEGIVLLNNCRYNLGTSIWSEISSQALEISSELACPNVWINNHGTFEAGEPLQLLGFSGNCVLGGNDGIFEYLSFGLSHTTEENKSNEDENLNNKKVTAVEMAVAAECAFNIWQHNKNRRHFLKDIADSLQDSEKLSELVTVISSFAHIGNLTTFSQRTSQGHLVLKRKVPVGVFLLLVNTTNVNTKSFASLITPIIAFGNAVIVVFRQINPDIKLLIKKFTEVLPKNLFNVMVGIKNGIYLASDPHIQDIWVYDENAISMEFLQTLKNHSARTLKNIWVVPKSLPASPYFFQKQCLRNHVVWLTNTDQFP